MEKIKILVFPDGEINSIELHDALSSCVNVELYGASSIERHGKYVFKNHISNLPMLTDPSFYDSLNDIIDEYKIDLIFPTHDTVSLELVNNQSIINAKVVAGDLRTVNVCRSKKATYELFADCDFVPKQYSLDTASFEFPLFIKPDIGQGSVGAKKILKREDLANVKLDEYVITEFLSGDECTVDCITDKYGKLAYCSPRSRKRMMAGVCVSGKTEELTNEIKSIAEIINHRLNFLGLWYFQIKKDNVGKYKLLEVSSRCAGTMCLTRAKGVNLPLLSAYVAMGYDISVMPNSYCVEMDRTLISRYTIDYDYDTVYFDFDDTLIVDNKVNLKAIWFLYQCLNNRKEIILLTKHENKLYDSMNKYKINTKIFSKIIHIAPNNSKSSYIRPNKAIFVDNAYKERKDVESVHHIPVFDVDNIEVLMDWRS